MRKSSALVCVAAIVAVAASVAAKPVARYRIGGTSTPTSVYVGLNATNKAGAIAETNAAFPWINDANAIWSGVTIPRYNKAAIRWPAGWASHLLSVNVQCTTLTNSDGKLAVVVDGVLATTINATGHDRLLQHFDVLIPALPTSYLEIWEPFSGRNILNNGADAPIETCYVIGAFLPFGQAIAKPAATRALVTVGDSIVSACVGTCTNSIEAYDGLLGHLRAAADARGWATVSLDYGSGTLRGDGLTPANWVTLIEAAVASTGAPAATVYFQIGRNDWNYYGMSTVSSTPTQVGADLQTIVSALPASYTIVITSPWPNTSEVANGGGFTLGSYRAPEESVTGTNVTIVRGGTACSFVSSTMTGDGVHFNSLGVTTVLPCVETPLGLP